MKILLSSAIALAMIACRGTGAPQSAAKEASGPTLQTQQALSSQEAVLLAGHETELEVVTRPNIVLMWPRTARPTWYAESGVTDPSTLADWLERVYLLQVDWTAFDPNEFYRAASGEFNRLVFIADGQGDFVFAGGHRPFIGLRDPFAPGVGKEDWFGWLTHELSHDFWHEHPTLKRVKQVWGEGMCDYSRPHLLSASGMPQAGARDRQRVMAVTDYRDAYLGAAKRLLEFEQAQSLDGPKAVWEFLRDKDFAVTVGSPDWVRQNRG